MKLHTPPSRSHMVPDRKPFELDRPQLLERIRTVDETALIVLEAPGGYGKSTLLAQYANARLTAAWLTLTSEERDVRSFLQVLAESIRQTFLLEMTAFAAALAVGASGAKLARTLADDCNHTDANFTIVVDKAERLGADSANALLTFVSHLGLGHRVVIAARPSHHLKLGDQLGDREIFRLGESDLCLSRDEACLLFALTDRDADAEAVWERTQGWPLAVHMVARGANADTQNLVDDILATLSSSLGTALTEMSVLEAWGVSDATALGVTLPLGWERELQESSVPFTIRDGIFQPHDIFRDRLLERLRSDLEYVRLQRAASVQYEKRDQRLQATYASLEADDLERAVALSWPLINGWSTRWEWMTLRGHLERFPSDALPSNIRAALGASLLQTGAQEEAYSLFIRLLHADESVGRAYSGLTAYEMQRGDFRAAAQWAEKGLALSPPPFERLLLRQFQATLLAGRDWPGAYAAATEAAEIVRMINVPILETGTVPAEIAAAQGLERESDEAYRRFYRESRKELLRVIEIAAVQGYPNQMIFALSLLADLDFQQGQSDRSIAMVDDLIGRRLETNPHTTPHLLQRRGNHYQASCEWDRAIAEYERGLESSLELQNFSITHQFKFALCECYRYKGDRDKARGYLFDALGGSSVPNRALEDPDRYYLEGLLAFDAKRLDAAEVAFTSYLERADEAVGYRHRIVVGYAYAAELARLRREFTKAHVDALQAAVDRYQAIWTLQRERSFLAELYPQLVDYGWDLQMLPEQLAVSPKNSENGRLVVTTLGAESAELNGRPLDLFPKAFELLVYLILHNPCSAEDICYALWGECSDKTRANLRNQVSAIRKRFRAILGDDEGLIHFDAASKRYHVFERLVVQIDVTRLLESLESIGMAERRANAVLPDQFLRKKVSPWIVDYRQRLENQMVQLNDTVALSDPD